jgi:hypothetical protein
VQSNVPGIFADVHGAGGQQRLHMVELNAQMRKWYSAKTEVEVFEMLCAMSSSDRYRMLPDCHPNDRNPRGYPWDDRQEYNYDPLAPPQ